jgi:hypothetical protein
LVVHEAAAPAAEDLVGETRQRTLVSLVTERGQRERAVAGRVVADRRDAALRDRQLNAKAVVERDGERRRRADRKEAAGGTG